MSSALANPEGLCVILRTNVRSMSTIILAYYIRSQCYTILDVFSIYILWSRQCHTKPNYFSYSLWHWTRNLFSAGPSRRVTTVPLVKPSNRHIIVAFPTLSWRLWFSIGRQRSWLRYSTSPFVESLPPVIRSG